MGEEIHPSEDAFEIVWQLISGAVETHNDRHPECILSIKEDAKGEIWRQYLSFNKFCRETYMSKDVQLLDRHKVCACYMFAIIKAGLLKYDEKGEHGRVYLYDESIAITVGMSLLRAFIIASINHTDIDETEKQVLVDRVDNGIKFPKAHHGEYVDNFKLELYYTKKEGNYNILSIAHTLFLLECLTMSDSIKKKSCFDRVLDRFGLLPVK